MVTRKLQYQNGSYFSVIPRALVDSLGLKSGDIVSFGIEDNHLIIAPVTAAKQATGAASSPVKECAST